ncbi:ABC transporter ATP-binding protein [uncultured Clostridium sp.]|uniref:ABC transporter ATP-binding protein n=1 Tax=uncultured Clostridium sp. TaxID=59620 RepID=UPI0025F96293|nr:ABC transporter ATP-binding protein [uncultured Clostridium sp.]
MKIEIKRLCKRFGYKEIFKDFNLELTSENINCIIGNSGGGKSTLLNILAGITSKDDGEIIGVNKEDISYVFQEDRLIPWLTIRDNMELFVFNYFAKENAYDRINKIFNLLNIEDVLGEYPKNLSGGMRQRVNIARAFLKPSKLILMDEPFKSLDYKTKYLIMDNLLKVLEKENRLVVFVTHDIDEAIFTKGKIYVLGGRPFEVKGVFCENLESKKEKILNLI